MYIKNALDRGGGIFKAILIVSAAAALTLSSQSCKEGALNGIEKLSHFVEPSHELLVQGGVVQNGIHHSCVAHIP